MISECKGYLADKLKALGLTNIYQTAEDAQKHRVLPHAILSSDMERFSQYERLKYSPRRVAEEVDTVNMVRRIRWRTHTRDLDIRLAIAHHTNEEAEDMLTSILVSLDRRFLDAGNNAVLISGSTANSNDDTSLLRNQAGAEALIHFGGGVYKDVEEPIFDVATNLIIEEETGV